MYRGRILRAKPAKYAHIFPFLQYVPETPLREPGYQYICAIILGEETRSKQVHDHGTQKNLENRQETIQQD